MLLFRRWLETRMSAHSAEAKRIEETYPGEYQLVASNERGMAKAYGAAYVRLTRLLKNQKRRRISLRERG